MFSQLFSVRSAESGRATNTAFSAAQSIRAQRETAGEYASVHATMPPCRPPLEILGTSSRLLVDNPFFQAANRPAVEMAHTVNQDFACHDQNTGDVHRPANETTTAGAHHESVIATCQRAEFGIDEGF